MTTAVKRVVTATPRVTDAATRRSSCIDGGGARGLGDTVGTSVSGGTDDAHAQSPADVANVTADVAPSTMTLAGMGRSFGLGNMIDARRWSCSATMTMCSSLR